MDETLERLGEAIAGALAGSVVGHWTAHDELTITAGARHRPFIEVADPFTMDERAFHAAGIGGAQIIEQAVGLVVDEATLAFDTTPVRWLSFYGDGHAMRISDGDLGFMASTGAAIDTIGVFGKFPVSLYARWDTYLTGFRREQPAYYSPGFFDAHSVGPEVRVRRERRVVV